MTVAYRRSPTDSGRVEGNVPTASTASTEADPRSSPTAERVTFDSKGVRCAADWYWPTTGEPPWPAVVLAHGFGGQRHLGLAPYAERFAAAGIAAFVFDYRHFGESAGTPRRLIAPRRQLADRRAALRSVRSNPRVEANRVALWGTSFGAGDALATACRDPEVAAVVAQTPFVDGRAAVAHQTRYHGAIARTRIIGRAIADRLGAAVGRGPVEVPFVSAPAGGGLLNTPGALDGFRSVVPDGEPFVNRTPARVVFALPWYRPGRGTDRIDAPVHVVVAERDRLLPSGPTERLLERLAEPSVHRVPAAHFAVHHDPWFEPVVDRQVAFLCDALGVGELDVAN